jgi:hypothetical protein
VWVDNETEDTTKCQEREDNTLGMVFVFYYFVYLFYVVTIKGVVLGVLMPNRLIPVRMQIDVIVFVL